jgi:polysaccharide pyruvyl transferase WcaK-like protein
MTIQDFIKNTKLDNSILIGYYGGGNFGDELLLETLLNVFKKNNIKDIGVYYLNYVKYDNYHNRFDGYKIITNNIKFLYNLLKTKNLIIGGGGIWGLDFNKNVLILSIIIFLQRHVLRKKIYLLGVGYYNSTTKLGKFAAFLVAISSNIIIARDMETYLNFSKFSKKVSLDKDIVFNFAQVDDTLYESGVNALERIVDPTKKNIFITLRRFSKNEDDNFREGIRTLIEKNTDKHIILLLLETKTIDMRDWLMFEQLAGEFGNIVLMDFDFNPMALLFLFRKYNKTSIVISPQLHGQMVAHLTNTPFLPISYDNKNTELFKLIGVSNFLDIHDVDYLKMQNFIDKFYE